MKKYEHDAAMTYHQMGTISDMRQDFVSANEWYQKALTIFKEQKDEYCMACTYYQLGKSVQEQGNSKIAKNGMRRREHFSKSKRIITL